MNEQESLNDEFLKRIKSLEIQLEKIQYAIVAMLTALEEMIK